MRQPVHASSRDYDLAVGGLSVSIEARHAPESEDYWDGNWLAVTARCASSHSQVTVTGPILHLSEIAAFKIGCERMASGAVAETGLYCQEPNLKIELWAVPGKQYIGKIRITPDHKSEMHDFGFALDGAALTEIATSCQRILQQYPIRGKNQKPQ